MSKPVKRILVLLICLLFSLLTFGQQDTTVRKINPLADKFIVKGKAQINIGFICELSALTCCIIVADEFSKENGTYMLHHMPVTTAADLKRFQQGRTAWYCTIGALTAGGIAFQISGNKLFKKGVVYLGEDGVGYRWRF